MSDSNYIPPTGGSADNERDEPKESSPIPPPADSLYGTFTVTPRAPKVSEPPKEKPKYRSYADELKAKREAAESAGIDPDRADLDRVRLKDAGGRSTGLGVNAGSCAIGCLLLLVAGAVFTGGLAIYVYYFLWPVILLVFAVLAIIGFTNAGKKK